MTQTSSANPVNNADARGLDHEYRAAVSSGILGIASKFSRVQMTGKDRSKLLHNLCTNDILRLPVGSGCEAFALDVRGRLSDYLLVYSVEDSLWLEVGPERAAGLIAHLDRYILREDVQLHDRSPTHAQFQLLGPKSAELLAGLAKEPLPSEDLRVVECVIEGAKVQIRRRDWGRHVRFDLVVPLEDADRLWQRLVQLGEAAGFPIAGETCWEVLRIESGIPCMDLDISADNLAQEVGRDRQAIHFSKGCYLGQETVARLDALGHVNRVLRGIVVDSPTATVGTSVLLAGKEVGKITSVQWSPRLERTVALGIVRVAAKPGSEVELAEAEGPRRGIVHELPLS